MDDMDNSPGGCASTIAIIISVIAICINLLSLIAKLLSA